jgi:hypothetical protein
MLCCEIERQCISELPFRGGGLIIDFYDGPLAGFVSCPICKFDYYYELLEYDLETQYCRVFRFAQIPFNENNIFKDFGFVDKEFIPRDIGNRLKLTTFLGEIKQYPTTHICVSDDYFQTGLWRKTVPEDIFVNNWQEYLGIYPHNDSCCFQMKNLDSL